MSLLGEVRKELKKSKSVIPGMWHVLYRAKAEDGSVQGFRLFPHW
jgi:hypothetical protein